MKQLLKSYSKYPAICLVMILLIRCESNDRYYRPDVPEKLCTFGIIDIDDTASSSHYEPLIHHSSLRHLSFEKSFQSEYPKEMTDSIREFEFTISSSEKELFRYFSDSTVKKIIDLRIPDSVVFNPEEKYFLHAKEKSVQEISAEVIPSESPSEPELISINRGKATLLIPNGCDRDTTAKYVTINFSFNKDQNLYYAVMVEGWGFSFSSSFVTSPGFLDFSITESNTPGFFSEMQGLNTYHYVCTGIHRKIEASPAPVFLIEGSKIPDPKCSISVYIQYWDGYSPYVVFKAIRIRLLSVPKELYHFEKSLYTYKKTAGDPFTEPVYLGGNIKGGVGVFAICRSTGLKIDFSPWI